MFMGSTHKLGLITPSGLHVLRCGCSLSSGSHLDTHGSGCPAKENDVTNCNYDWKFIVSLFPLLLLPPLLLLLLQLLCLHLHHLLLLVLLILLQVISPQFSSEYTYTRTAESFGPPCSRSSSYEGPEMNFRLPLLIISTFQWGCFINFYYCFALVAIFGVFILF